MHTADNVVAPSAFARTANRPSPPADCRAPTLFFAEYDFCQVARRLGILHFQPRTIVDTIRKLVDHEGFPAPLTVRVVSGRLAQGGRAVTRKSRWRAQDVDAWLDRDPSPAMAKRREESELQVSRARMHGRAELAVA